MNVPFSYCLLPISQAAAAFRELQRLLLLSCAGDECAWSDEIDQITFQLLATGAVARLREGLPEDPTVSTHSAS